MNTTQYHDWQWADLNTGDNITMGDILRCRLKSITVWGEIYTAAMDCNVRTHEEYKYQRLTYVPMGDDEVFQRGVGQEVSKDNGLTWEEVKGLDGYTVRYGKQGGHAPHYIARKTISMNILEKKVAAAHAALAAAQKELEESRKKEEDIVVAVSGTSYTAEFKPGIVKFGCAEIANGLFKDADRFLGTTCSTGNRQLTAVQIGAGLFTKDILAKIVKRLK